MRRFITYSTTVTALTLFLFAATLWRRSDSPPALSLYWNRSNHLLTFTSYHGVLIIRSVRVVAFEGPVIFFIPGGWSGNFRPWDDSAILPLFPEEDPPPNTILGFFYTKDHPGNGPPIRTVDHELRLPWYALTLLPLLPLALCLRTIRRYRRQWSREKHGYCKACGYDLRASINKCPECGTDISTQHRPPLTTANLQNSS